MNRTTVLLALILVATGHPAVAGGCDPGTVAAPASFDTTVSRFAVTFDDGGREGRIEADGKVPSTTRSGGWLAHCHILEHSGRGMMTFFQVGAFADGLESGDASAWSATTGE